MQDYEDRVHDLALLVFDSSSGNKVAEYFDEEIQFVEKSKAFVVKLTPGQRDFYFVANMPMGALKNINGKSAMDTYMALLNNLDPDLYLNATTSKGFPMSRVYLNQNITEGGTLYAPARFTPEGEDRIKLRRAVAKLEVNILGSSSLAVESIYYHNAYRQFSLSQLSTQISSNYYLGSPLKKKNDSTYVYYMPEAIVPPTTSWQASADHKPINYFLITTLGGTTYKIPIVTYQGAVLSNYLSYARGEETDKPDYNIYRNHHYRFSISKLERIEILYSVLPWQLVDKSTFLGYWYNVEVENDRVNIHNTVNACPPHSIRLETSGTFLFSDGTSVKVFNDYNAASSSNYQLNSVPVAGSGAYLKIYYNGKHVKTFSK
jgi:hypothetical protein